MGQILARYTIDLAWSLEKSLKKNKTRKVFITARPLTPHHPLLKIVYLEEHYMDVLSKTK